MVVNLSKGTSATRDELIMRPTVDIISNLMATTAHSMSEIPVMPPGQLASLRFSTGPATPSPCLSGRLWSGNLVDKDPLASTFETGLPSLTGQFNTFVQVCATLNPLSSTAQGGKYSFWFSGNFGETLMNHAISQMGIPASTTEMCLTAFLPLVADTPQVSMSYSLMDTFSLSSHRSAWLIGVRLVPERVVKSSLPARTNPRVFGIVALRGKTGT